MAELSPVPLADLVRRMRREVETRQAIFDLPYKKWFVSEGDLDFGAVHFGRRASTPVGPAAGPHTQLAQNIVLSWLAGSRILELKTVQVDDRLHIPRPCIHVPNVGYNVEWSQELLVGQSQLEYAKAVYLIEILKSTRAFGLLPSSDGFDTIFDISVGYDLEGIRSEKVTGFLRALREPGAMFDGLRAELTGDLAAFRDLQLPESISDCVTLSTFHGCPADQIESICRYLIEQCDLDAIVKLNPTLLGFETVRRLLFDQLGYHHLELDRAAFDCDLQYDDGLEILRRLHRVAEGRVAEGRVAEGRVAEGRVAEGRGTTVGVKFTNTLVVKNRQDYFPTQTDPYMYLSGPPLHVISMTLMQRFRDDVGFELPVSFSAGIDARNFPAAVACGMVPITTCTDLLRQGGYGRLPLYLRGLGKAMKKLGVTSREAYVLSARGHARAAVSEALEAFSGTAEVIAALAPRLDALTRESPDELPRTLREAAAAAGLDGDAVVLHATRIAGRLNGRDIVPALADDPRYHAERNRKTPKRINSTLALYDCINCDLCISACPNDAIFAYEAEPVETSTEVIYGAAGATLERRAGSGFHVAERHQLAVVEGSCNDCSNCEVYCPEEGAPFVVKERLFMSRETFAAQPSLDGFCREDHTLYARLGGEEFELQVDPEGRLATLTSDALCLEVDWDRIEVLGGQVTVSPPLNPPEGTEAVTFDTALLWRMKVVWQSILHE